MSRKRVLLIDDDLAHMTLVRDALQADGHHVFIHAKAFTAIEVARQLLPDLILLDVNRSDLIGEKIFAVLRATDSTRDIPVIFCSTGDEHALRRSAKRFGARGYVIKGNVALLRHSVAQLAGEETHLQLRETSQSTAEGGGPR